MKERIIAKLPT